MPNRILLSLAVLMTSIAPDAAAQAASTSGAEGTFEWATFAGEAGTRRYRLYIPASRDAQKPAPLVVMLHGCTQDPDDFARGTRFNLAADETGALVVYPEQPAASQPQKCWTWYDPAHQARNAGEPALLAALTREVIAKHNADPARVYVVGVSAGGAMAVNLAASYPDLFAALGVHSGIAYRAAGNVMQGLGVMKTGGADSTALAAAAREALGGRVLPIIVIHGGADAVVAPVNGEQLAAQWAAAHGLTNPQKESITGDAGREIFHTWYEGEGGKTVVQLLVVEGLGHAWSGGSPEGTFTDREGLDATPMILDFLLRHTR
jgi:poly(hydroxyalkanoate) depolymerase family esterase